MSRSHKAINYYILITSINDIKVKIYASVKDLSKLVIRVKLLKVTNDTQNESDEFARLIAVIISKQW